MKLALAMKVHSGTVFYSLSECLSWTRLDVIFIIRSNGMPSFGQIPSLTVQIFNGCDTRCLGFRVRPKSYTRNIFGPKPSKKILILENETCWETTRTPRISDGKRNPIEHITWPYIQEELERNTGIHTNNTEYGKITKPLSLLSSFDPNNNSIRF